MNTSFKPYEQMQSVDHILKKSSDILKNSKIVDDDIPLTKELIGALAVLVLLRDSDKIILDTFLAGVSIATHMMHGVYCLDAKKTNSMLGNKKIADYFSKLPTKETTKSGDVILTSELFGAIAIVYMMKYHELIDAKILYLGLYTMTYIDQRKMLSLDHLKRFLIAEKMKNFLKTHVKFSDDELN